MKEENLVSEDKSMKYTILVNSCDAYSDLWEPFFVLLKKYWQGEIPPIVLNTESKNFSMCGLDIRCVHCPDNPKGYYGKRMRYALKRIETEYVLCMLDDFFLREPVDRDEIERLVSYMESNANISCFNFENSFEGAPSERYPGYITLPPVADYKLNMQAALWRTSDLIKLWKDKVNPWQWEAISNKLTYNTRKEYYFLAANKKMPLHYGKKPGLSWGVVRGKWYEEDVVPLFLKEGITVDYSARGFYHEVQEQSAPPLSMIEFNMRYFYILGASFTIKNFLYSTVYRRIMLLFGRELPVFDQHLAEKYNNKR